MTITAHPVFVIFLIIAALICGCSIFCAVIGAVVNIFKPWRRALRYAAWEKERRLKLQKAVEQLFQAARSNDGEAIGQAQEKVFNISRSL